MCKQWGLYQAFAFFLCVWNFGTCWVKGVYVSSPQEKACTLSLKEPPRAEISHTCCWIFIAEEECALHDPSREGESKQPLAHSSRCCLCLPPYDQAIFPYHITVISLSPEHNCMLCPMRASSKFEWGGDLGISHYSHQQKCCIFFSYCRLFWNFNDIDDCFEMKVDIRLATSLLLNVLIRKHIQDTF